MDYFRISHVAQVSAMDIDNHIIGKDDPSFDGCADVLARMIIDWIYKTHISYTIPFYHIWDADNIKTVDEFHLKLKTLAHLLLGYKDCSIEVQKELRDKCIQISNIARDNCPPPY